MRVRCASSTSSILDPCASYTYGQTEDYMLMITNGNGAPIADFEADTTHIYINDAVNFTDMSLNTPTSWLWTFTGASTVTSTLQNPASIIYPAPGCYPVTLKAQDANGFSIKTDTCYIFVDLALGSSDNISGQYSILPNPFTNSFTLNYGRIKNAVANITDMQGRLIKTIVLADDKSSQIIDLTNCSKGIYLLSIDIKNQMIYKHKLIKTE